MTTLNHNRSLSVSRRKMYRIWYSMKRRCENQNDKGFKYYGSRGISVCERWQVFENFYEDMGDKPDGKSLDRINNDSNYEKDNCRWATHKQQSRNTRRNVFIEWNGRVQTRKDWADELGFVEPAIKRRLEKWGVEKTMTTKKQVHGKQHISEEDVIKMRQHRAKSGYFWGSKEFAKKYGLDNSSIRRAVNGITYSHLPSWETFK